MPPARLLIAALAFCSSAVAQEPGWHYSPLPGEGDRASLGCDQLAIPNNFVCLAVRCEDDFSTGVHIYASHHAAITEWEVTLDRENRTLKGMPGSGPYGVRFVEDEAWLLDGLREGAFIYVRPAGATAAPFRFIDLSGSLYAINEALAFCKAKVPVASPGG